MLTSVSSLKAGMVRESSFNAPGGMGKGYKTTERSRLVEFVPGKSALVESYVLTKAPYGDKFHVMLRHKMTSLDKASTRLEVRCTIVYSANVNGMIKGMIEKGSREGMRKSNDNVLQLLKEIATVKQCGTEPTSEKPVIELHLLQREHLESIFGRRMIAVLEPWACLVSDFLEHVPLLNIFTPSRILLLSLSILTSEIIRMTVAILGTLKKGSENPVKSPFGYILHYFFKAFHVPGSMHEVFCSFLFLVFLRWILSVMSMILPDPKIGQSKDDDTVYGVKYEGYRHAMSNVSSQYVGIDARSEFALDQIAKGMEYVAKKLHIEPKDRRTRARESIRQKLSRHHHQKHKKTTKAVLAGQEPPSPEASTSTHSIESLKESEDRIDLNPIAYQAPDAPLEVLEKSVVEEIFESERHQPFRGFGSTWPGHFLPTDRFSRWNVRRANRNGIYSSQDMSVVVPSLPDDWAWIESSWTLDLSGIPSGTTDKEGWSYATDFPKDIIFPFPPGSGKLNISKFVRTRRWLRTRVPKTLMDSLTQSSTQSEISPANHVLTQGTGGKNGS